MEKTRAVGATSAPDDEQRASEDVVVEAAAALNIGDDANYEPALAAGESESGSDIRARGTSEAGAPAPRAAPSESSTKPSSLDGKSNMSASSALDEKDSLRPDDSASTRAATEDEDAFAALQSSGPCSHSGSETGAGAAFRAQFHQLSEQIGEPQRPEAPDTAFIPPGPDGVGGASSEGNNSHLPPLAGSTAANGTNVPFGFSLEPDEKLVEALENPKDRLFVLRLEQDLIEFVKDSKYVCPITRRDPALDICVMLTLFLCQGAFPGTPSLQLLLPASYPQIGRLLLLNTLCGSGYEFCPGVPDSVLQTVSRSDVIGTAFSLTASILGPLR
jgi:hypothetical protein